MVGKAKNAGARKTNYDYTKGTLASAPRDSSSSSSSVVPRLTLSVAAQPELIDVIIEEKAKLFVCAVGVPPKWAVVKLHGAGILCMNMIGAPKHVAKCLPLGWTLCAPRAARAGGTPATFPPRC